MKASEQWMMYSDELEKRAKNLKRRATHGLHPFRIMAGVLLGASADAASVAHELEKKGL